MLNMVVAMVEVMAMIMAIMTVNVAQLDQLHQFNKRYKKVTMLLNCVFGISASNFKPILGGQPTDDGRKPEAE